jgi:hypothetical protein
MLVISLFLSVLLLLIVNGSVWFNREAGPITFVYNLAFVIGPIFLGCFFPAVAIQALLLCGAAIIWRSSDRGLLRFLALSCGATLIAYGVAGVIVLRTEREYARLRVLYPYESLETRLPTPRPVLGAASLRPDATRRLYRLEEEIAKESNTYREFELGTLHEHAVALFINSPGFGFARMLPPNEQNLAVNLRREPVPLQPGPRLASAWSPGELKPPAPEDETELSRMLDGSILDYVNPRGFGYFKDRRHVAGFLSHRFSRVPRPANRRWWVQTLELVGLLLKDEPEVYRSDSLPRMDELRGAPTRPLDRFESYALDALRRGDDLFVTQEKEGMRMLGAIRSNRRCVDCHGGARGDLLGAFSYTIRPEGP